MRTHNPRCPAGTGTPIASSVKTSKRLSILAGIAATALGVVALAPAPAAALPFITAGSQLDFTGGVNPIGGTDIYNATGLDFRTSGLASVGTAGTLSLAASLSGVFTALNAATCPSAVAGGCGTITDLLSYSVATQTLNNPALPVLSLLTVTQGPLFASFDLTGFVISETNPTSNTLGTVTVSGAGLLSFTGYAPTSAIFTLTGQGPLNTSFSGSVISTGTLIPEPASLAVIGAGMFGLGMVRRKARTER